MVIEVSDETTPLQWKFGDRVKVTKVIITIKHLKTQKIEDSGFFIGIPTEIIHKKKIDYLVNNLLIKYNLWDTYNIFFDINNILDEKYETTRDYSQMDRSFNFGIRRVY